MDFFLDSGIFIWKCDKNDNHHEECKTFFESYPPGTNNYYSAKKVLDELSWRKLKFIKKGMGYDDKILRRIHLCIQRWLNERMAKLVDYENNNHPKFKPLCRDIRTITGYNTNDAIIVTNAIYWCCDCNSEEDSTLVTVDFYDIVKKKDQIIETAVSKCDKRIPLNIKPVWDI